MKLLGVCKRLIGKIAMPRSLSGRLVALILLALLISHLFSLFIAFDERRVAFRAEARARAVDQIAAVMRLIEQSPPGLHRNILRAASSPTLRFRMAPVPSIEQREIDSRLERYFRSGLAQRLGKPEDAVLLAFRGNWQHERAWLSRDWLDPNPVQPSPKREDLPWWHDEEDDDDDDDDDRHHWDDDRRFAKGQSIGLRASIQLRQGGWLEAASVIRDRDRPWGLPALASLIVSGSLVVLIVIWLVRRSMRPLKQLTAAADALGRGEVIQEIRPDGPDDIAQLIRSFNQMQERLDRFVRDRSQMLAMMSHDLRTPITSLRLRAEMLDDLDARDRILETLDELQQMSEEVLAFMRSEAQSEETREIDLSSMIDAVVGDFEDQGAQVAADLPDRLPFRCRPTALKRALCNIVDNALQYGSSAEVRIVREDDAVIITVLDTGPGMKPEDMKRAFDPFIRLEDSRNRTTGGTGLGLSITRSIINAHGGEITLANRESGGLCVTIRLPM